MATDVDQLIDAVIAREGGYVNDPADAGGETNFGITVAEARACGYAGSMRDLPRDTAVAIYRKQYWTDPRFDQVAARSQRIAAELFDTGVNMGTVEAATFFQRALTALNRGGKDYADLTPDGHIGGVTIAAFVAYLNGRGAGAEAVMLKALDCLQGAHYIELAEKRSADEKFLFGWLANRIGNVA